MRVLVLAALGLVCSGASAWELGYSVFGVDGGSSFKSSRGLDLRLHFGGDSDRYSGDRFTLQCGYVKERVTRAGYVKHRRVDSTPGYGFCAFLHRWYMRPPRWAPEVRFFAGTGIMRRDVEVDGGAGDYFVGSKLCFAQTLGMKWREIVEVAYDHCSTGRLVLPNKGEDFLRFSIIGVFGEK